MKTEEILASIMILGLLWWVVFGTAMTEPPTTEPPPTEPPVPTLSVPVIDIQETIDGSVRNGVLPGSIYVFYVHPDREPGVIGHLCLVGDQPGVYGIVVGDNKDNGNERVAGTSDGTWFVAVDAQHADGTLVRSDEVTFTISGNTIIEGSNSPPAPPPDPEPGGTQVRLEWNENTEPDLVGYRVYRRENPGPYLETHQTQDPAFNWILPPGRHYFAVSAYDWFGNESGITEEVFTDVAPSE